jgi:hypothetical protein
MSLLNEETEKRLALLFAPEDQDVARVILRECGTDSPELSDHDGDRIRFAVLKLSDGNLKKLRAAVQLAQLDFRDVLMGAGFGEDILAHISWLPERKW